MEYRKFDNVIVARIDTVWLFGGELCAVREVRVVG